MNAQRSRSRKREPAMPVRRAAIIAVATAAVALVVVAALIVVPRLRERDAEPRVVLPPPSAAEATVAITFEDFTGAGTCAECHREQHDAWRRSTHGRAGGAPGPDLLVRSFDGQPIRFRDAIVTPRVRGGEYVFVIARAGRDEEVMRVDGVVGGAHMVGGGTQGFITRHADGSLRFIPFEWIRHESVWFCNTNTRLDRGWLPITPEMSIADCGDWPPVRVLGDQPRFANCQSCHGSQIDVAPQSGRPHATRFASLAIDCEACHGPGRRHIEIMRGQHPDQAEDIGMRALATLTKDESLDVCFQCHALKDVVRPGHLSGKNLRRHYSLAFPLLDDAPVFADGRIRTFAYQQGHLYSDCYLSGSMTCVDCHDPHSQGYRDVTGAPIAGRFDDRQCTACHASKAERIEAHTRHAADSPGSRCVACHMPYLQEPEVGAALRYARSDHTIAVPRAAADAALGIEVACQLCHGERSVAALQAQVDQWHGALKPRHPVVESLFRGDSPLTALEAAATPGTPRHRMAEFTALVTLLDSLRLAMPALPRETERTLRRLAMDDDDDIAATSLAALHYARGGDPTTRRFLADRLATLGAAEHSIRDRWGVLLGFLGDTHRERGDAAGAIATYRKALEIAGPSAHVLLSLGIAHADAGDFLAADTLYRASLRLDANSALAWVNLGIARAARGDAAAAMDAYQAAMRVDPVDPLPHFNLGNLYMRADRPLEAATEYRNAIARGPQLAIAHFNLARALFAVDDHAGARDALREGLMFDRDNASARATLQQLEAALGAPAR